jgi:transposase
VRFETPPGEQAQVDLARFEVEFTDESGATRIVWLFSMVLGYSRFIIHQDLQSVLRCHIAALEAIGGVPREILCDRMKTAVIGEDPMVLSFTTAPFSTSRGITASSRVTAGHTDPRPTRTRSMVEDYLKIADATPTCGTRPPT